MIKKITFIFLGCIIFFSIALMSHTVTLATEGDVSVNGTLVPPSATNSSSSKPDSFSSTEEPSISTSTSTSTITVPTSNLPKLGELIDRWNKLGILFFLILIGFILYRHKSLRIKKIHFDKYN